MVLDGRVKDVSRCGIESMRRRHRVEVWYHPVQAADGHRYGVGCTESCEGHRWGRRGTEKLRIQTTTDVALGILLPVETCVECSDGAQTDFISSEGLPVVVEE